MNTQALIKNAFIYNITIQMQQNYKYFASWKS